MSTRPRYHKKWYWGPDREDIRWAATTLATALGADGPSGGWRHQLWQPRPRGWTWRDGPPGSRSQPPRRWLSRKHDPRQRPHPSKGPTEPEWRWRSQPQTPPHDWRCRVLPRRGPPVATIKVPRRYQQESVKERRSSGTIPGGPPRGGPERSAGDPRRNPRGGLCGGPERSAKEPQTLHKKTTRQSTNGKRQGKTGDNPKPMVITVEHRWGKGEIEKDGDRSREQRRGERGRSGKNRTGLSKSSSIKTGKELKSKLKSSSGRADRDFGSAKRPLNPHKHKIKRRISPSRKQKTNQSPKKLTPGLMK